MINIKQLNKDRFLLLHRLYEKTEGDTFEIENMWELGKELGFDKKYTDRITEYLEKEMLLEYPELGGSISITHYGVKEVEAAVSNPEEPTNYFPPVNIINIHRMENSQLQQGSHSSNLTATFNTSNIPSIEEFLILLKSELPNLSLEQDDKKEIVADITTIDSQITSSRPKQSIIKESLESIKRILEGAGGSILANQLLQNLPALINMI